MAAVIPCIRVGPVIERWRVYVPTDTSWQVMQEKSERDVVLVVPSVVMCHVSVKKKKNSHLWESSKTPNGTNCVIKSKNKQNTKTWNLKVEGRLVGKRKRFFKRDGGQEGNRQRRQSKTLSMYMKTW